MAEISTVNAGGSPGTMQSMTKDVYDEVQTVIPKKITAMRAIEFSKRKRPGRSIKEPVWTSEESGFSFSNAETDLDDLNGSIAGEAPEATIGGCEIMLQSRATVKALKSTYEAGEAAYKKYQTQILINMRRSMMRMGELSLVNGDQNIGVVDSVTDGGTNVCTITLEATDWIPGAFIGRRNMKLDIYDATGVTKRNETTDIVVTSITPTLTGPVLALSGLESELDAIIATDILYIKGAKGQLCTGLTQIAGLASGDTYMGLDVDDYPDVWSGNIIPVGGDLSLGIINEGQATAAMRGGGDDSIMLVSPIRWTSLADDHNAWRRTDSSYNAKMGREGVQALEYETLTGTVSIEPSLYVRQSQAVSFPKDSFERIGTSDIDFNALGRGERDFQELEDRAACEYRCYSDFALKGEEITSCVLYTGITA